MKSPLHIMISAASSNETDRNSSKATTPCSLAHTEPSMSEEEFMFYFHLSKYADVKPERIPLTIEEELDRSIELSNRYVRQNSSGKQEWKNHIFMYNFFQRRGSRNRASRYLQKIENSKSDKIKACVSKIRKLDSEYVTLPSEIIDAEDFKLRRSLAKKAKAESKADKLNAERILKSIISGQI